MVLPSLFLIAVFFIWSFLLNILANHIIQNNKRFFFFPFFEIFTTVSFIALWNSSDYFAAYFILFSALAITIQTDGQSMLISRFVSLYLAPVGVIASYAQYLPITVTESILALISGYLFFYILNQIFYTIRKEHGLGQGDLDLMTLIGAFTGFLGCWFAILLGSLIGTITTFIGMIYTKKRISIMPFGPFLSIGTMIYIVFKNQIIIFLTYL